MTKMMVMTSVMAFDSGRPLPVPSNQHSGFILTFELCIERLSMKQVKVNQAVITCAVLLVKKLTHENKS